MAQFHAYEISEQVDPQRQVRTAGRQGLGGGDGGNELCSEEVLEPGTGVPAHHCECAKCRELYTLKWLILCEFNLKFKKKGESGIIPVARSCPIAEFAGMTLPLLIKAGASAENSSSRSFLGPLGERPAPL